MGLKIYDDSKNYTCQVIKLPNKISVKGLDNLVEVNVQGNSCLVAKDSPENELYLFFPAESQLSDKYLKENNLYRHETLNANPGVKPGFFEDNRRVKSIKFRGIISTGFVIPLNSLISVCDSNPIINLKLGDEFNEIDGVEICRKYIRRTNPGKTGFQNPRVSKIDALIDGKMAPEHIDTSHLMKNIHKLDQDSYIVVTYKLHGTSARTFRTLVKKKLSWKDRVAKFFGVLLEQPSILDKSVVEEGFCVRLEGSLRAENYKIKSKKFLAHESKALDKGVKDLEEEQTEENGTDSQPSI